MKSSSAFNIFTICVLCLSILGSAVTVTPVYAASITVNTTDDELNNDGDCSLREAIQAANTDAPIDNCVAGSGADIITLVTGTYQLTIATTNEDANANGDLDITDADGLTITGNNAIIQQTVIDRVFHVISATVTFQDLTITGGNSVGAGILASYSTVILNHVEVSGNTSAGRGGGIYNYYGTLTIQNGSLIGKSGAPNIGYGGGGIFTEGNSPNVAVTILDASTVSYNESPNLAGGGFYMLSDAQLIIRNGSVVSNNIGGDLGDYPPFTDPAGGGGIYGTASPTITISDSTVSNNTVNCVNNPGCGGGGLKGASSVTITNSTFSNNTVNCNASTSCGGGGIYNYATLTITNSTFSGNSATNNGGGIYNSIGTMTLSNNLVAGNTATVAGEIYNASTITSNNTLFGHAGMTNAQAFNGFTPSGSDITATSDGTNPATLISILDTTLADNGGPTQTLALVSGSPAINTADNTICSNAPVNNLDQRGVSRPQGAGCDIGAFEVDTSFPTVVSDSLVASYASGAGPSSFTVTFSENVYNPTGDTDPEDVTNPNNYLIVEDGVNGTFDTSSCLTGLATDDVQITVTSVTYNAGLLTATVNLSGAFPDGNYRLFVCGTTSIVDIALNELNNGLSDYTFDFIVATTSSVIASSLPSTGFAPNKITTLPAQPAKSAYRNLGDIWLEIPSQNVKANIVGVPQTEDGWDVTWLGDDAGWLNGTAFPSWTGNSVIAGHFYNASGLPGIFVNLSKLNYGDQIIVHLFGENYTFEVRETRIAFPYSTSYSYKHLKDHSYITLITCAGYNPLNATYLFRRIVRAVLVDVK